MKDLRPDRGSSTAARRREEDCRGYVLLVFALFSALLVISLYRMLPQYVFEGQRIKEEELIFRGQQYQRGIQLFVRKFGRYPASLEELEDTNQIRFVRQLYPDPMTEEGEWRLVHMGPDGTFYDSIHVTGQASGEGAEGGASGQRESDPFDLSRRDTETTEGGDAGEPATRASANPNPTQQPRGSGAVAAAPQRFGGGGIAGVATKHEGEGIKIVGGFKHYNEWEFLYDYRSDPLGLAAVNRVSGAGQQQRQQPGGQQGGQQGTGQSPAGQQPVGRNPLTGQPIGIPTPGFGAPGGIPGSPVPIPGGASPIPGGRAPLGNFPPSWNSPRPPTNDPFARP
jgi:hypothetical protein